MRKYLLTFLLLTAIVVPTITSAQSTRMCDPKNQCQDCKDNNGDKKADYDGNDTQGASGTYIEADPSCFTNGARDGVGKNGQPVTEEQDDVVSTIIPCTDKCSFSDIFRLLNNIIAFFFKTLLLPIFITILMYAGFKYITAQGNSSKIANLKKMLLNFVKGIILILCAWLIVRTIMTTLLSEDFKKSGVELIGN